MKIRLAERHALLTFCTISRQRATLCSFLSKKLLVVMSLLQVKRCFSVLFLTKRFDFIYFLLILHANKRILNSYSYV